MEFREMTVTPSMAKEWLKKNYHNRNINRGRVEILKSDIESGNFTLSPNPICFSEEGNLIDGQHRLMAVVLSNKPIQSLVAYNVPETTVIDKGLERSAGAALYMRGLISKEMAAQSKVAIVKRYLSVKTAKTSFPDSKIAEFIEEHESLISAAYSVTMKGRSHPITGKAGLQAAALAALMCGVSEEELTEFFQIVNTGFQSDMSQSAAVVLRNCLLSYGAMSGRNHANMLCAITQLAIKDFVTRTPRRNKYTKLWFPYIPDAKTKFTA